MLNYRILIITSIFLLGSIIETANANTAAKAQALKQTSNQNEEPLTPEFFNIEFMSMPPLDIDKSAASKCREKFVKVCGKEDLPLIVNFGKCLHKNYEQFRADQSCKPYAAGLINMVFLSTLPRTVSQCVIQYEYCEQKVDKTKVLPCVTSQKSLAPVCHKLINDMRWARRRMTSLYGAELSPDGSRL